jgi:hypothetical protein
MIAWILVQPIGLVNSGEPPLGVVLEFFASGATET